MSLPRVGVVHGPAAAVDLRNLIRASLGQCVPVLLVRRTVADRHAAFVEMARLTGPVHLLDKDPVEQARRLRLDGCTTFHDRELETCDLIQHELSLPGDPGPGRAWDKLRQRCLFHRAGVCSTSALAVESIDDFRATVKVLGLPGVLKPRRGVSGSGVDFLFDPRDVEDAIAVRADWADLLYEQFLPAGAHPSGTPWLADYVSVDTVTVGSEHHHVAVVDKPPMRIIRAGSRGRQMVTESGDVFPSRLTGGHLAEVLTATATALTALGVRDRVTHTELRIGPPGAQVIEVNGRIGGQVQRHLRTVDGLDMARAAFSVALGEQPDLRANRRSGFLCVLHIPFPERDGRVRSNVTATTLRDLPAVIGVDELARAGQPSVATLARACSLLVEANDAEHLDAVVLDVLDAVSDLFAADAVADGMWVNDLRAKIGAPRAAETA